MTIWVWLHGHNLLKSVELHLTMSLLFPNDHLFKRFIKYYEKKLKVLYGDCGKLLRIIFIS